MIRDATPEDAEAIAAIYNYYVKNTSVTFEEQTELAQQMQSRISQVQADNLPWIVLINKQSIVGYAYATKWKERSAYRFSVESSVYLSANAQRKGFGTVLYEALLDKLRQLDINSVIGGVTLPNPASVALHEKLGMKKVAHFSKVGFKFGEWLDVAYWQISLKA